MLFPDSLQQLVAYHFYDKELTLCEDAPTLNDEGGVVLGQKAHLRTFKGNVRFNALQEVQRDLGLNEEIDIAVTCTTEDGGSVKLGQILLYQGKSFRVTKIIPYDSHTLLIGRKKR